MTRDPSGNEDVLTGYQPLRESRLGDDRRGGTQIASRSQNLQQRGKEDVGEGGEGRGDVRGTEEVRHGKDLASQAGGRRKEQ